MINISGFGTEIQLTASNTFPAGFNISQFADDADPLDVPSVQIADTAMGLNGDLLAWSKANSIKITINVIPGSDDDKNLSILLDANRVARGKLSAKDTITLTIIYPDGSHGTLGDGVITDGMPVNSIQSAGRKKTKAYMFAFESVSGVQ